MTDIVETAPWLWFVLAVFGWILFALECWCRESDVEDLERKLSHAEKVLRFIEREFRCIDYGSMSASARQYFEKVERIVFYGGSKWSDEELDKISKLARGSKDD